MGRNGQAKEGSPKGPSKPPFAVSIPRADIGRHGTARYFWFGIVCTVWLLFVALRLADLQLVQGSRLTEKAARQQQSTLDIPPRRGAIFDTNGNELALSTPAESIGVFSDSVEDHRAMASQLAEVVDTPEAVIRQRLGKGGFQWVKRLATLAETQRARALGLAALHFEPEPKRYYPYGPVAAHVLGTVGIDHHGQAGIELKFESRLRGEPGLLVLQYDARQRRYGRYVMRPATAGDDIELTLDLNVQSLAHMELERAIKETKSQAGAIVLMRPDSGAVVAMANWPRFDPNNLERRAEDLERLRNFAVSYLVEPGSTFKVLTAAAALEEGVVTPEETFYCENGQIWIGRRRIRDHKPFATLSVQEILMRSSNVGIIKVASRLSADTLREYIVRFGFGSPTGVSLPGEAAGLLRPVERWSKSSWASLAMGQEIGVTTLQMARLFSAVANGGMLVEPHIVRSVRRGTSEAVEIVEAPTKRVLTAETAATMQSILENVVESGTGRRAQIPGFRVAGKTGTAQMINPVTRSYANGAYMASFCGYAPVSDPKLVGVVMLYDPRGRHYYGGVIAAPLFSAVVKKALRSLDVPPNHILRVSKPAPARASDAMLADFVHGDREGPVAEELLNAAANPPEPLPQTGSKNVPANRRLRSPMSASTAASTPPQDEVGDNDAASVKGLKPRVHRPIVVPDLQGLTMREAFTLATSLEIAITTSGSGVVLHQVPEPNAELAPGQAIHVDLGLGAPRTATVAMRRVGDGG